MKKSLSARIRDWLSTQDGPRVLSQIVAGTRLPDSPENYSLKVSYAIGVMFRDNILAREGVRHHFAYYQIRTVKPPMTKEQARARRTERERLRQQSRVWERRSREQYLADIAAQAAARRAKKQAEKEARAEARRKEREARRPAKVKRARRAAVKRPNNPKPIVVAQVVRAAPVVRREPSRVIVTDSPRPPAPKTVPVETIEEWMARTGRQPEVLADGVVSKPLKHVGHRSLNEASWKNRKKAA